jgi:uncharacterized protein with NRDE domain
MCLILIAHRADPRYSLVVAANRDEFFRRPTAAAEHWPDAPQVLGGRDLEKCGTWLGIARDGRWAAVTNFRDGAMPAPGSRSRGELVAHFLGGPLAPEAYLSAVQPIADSYPGFNLLAGNQDGLHYLSNRQGEPKMLAPGIYGLSNALLDTPWPKVNRGKIALHAALSESTGPDGLIETLLNALSDCTVAEDHELPVTGIAKDLEKRLSAAFIGTPGYGTRASSVLLIGSDGEVHFRERSFDEHAACIDDRRFRFAPTQAPAPVRTC